MIKLAWTSQEKKVIVLSLLSAGLAVATSLVNLYVSPTILSAVERRAPVAELAMTIAGFTLALMFVSGASSYVNTNTAYGRISVRLEIINLVNRKAETTSFPNLDDDGFLKLEARSMESICSNQSSGEAIWTTMTNLLADMTGLILYAGLLTSIEPVLILVILATAAAGWLIGNRINGYGYRHREEEAETEKKMEYLFHCSSDLKAAKEIRLFGMRPWLVELRDKAVGAYRAFHWKAEGVYLWARVADLILTFLRNAAAYGYLIGLVLQNRIEVAEFLLYFAAASGFSEWVTGVLGELNTLHRQALDISIIREYLDYPEPFRFEGGRRIPERAGQNHEIRLEGVSFRYPGAEKNTLTGIDLTLHPGEKLAVVGLNGAGKTTLVKLICGFLDPTEGRVLLDGEDIRKFERAEYYGLFSAVFQQFSLLAGTIAANVAQKEEDIDGERVRECLEKAGLWEKVKSLPSGCETRLNREVYDEAIMLSGGETQRLMLARALYKDGPFLVLDEPTAALDPIAESELYQKYDEMTEGKSSVYISHRLASTRFCDRIVMIGDGGICEEGTHEELLARGGRYAGLYEVQSKYYREGEMEDGEK